MFTLKKSSLKRGAYECASYATTSTAVLKQLSRHKDVKVRTAVADNQNTSANTYMELAQDGDVDLRYAMAENHHIDKRTLNCLALDINPFVAYRAQKTLLRLG